MRQRPFSPPPPAKGYIGHRGMAAFAPENTMASFKLAAHHGFDWIEFDLQLSQDKQLIIFHDHELDRTTNGKGFVQDHPSSYLVNLDAGSWFHSTYQQEKIPLFETCLPELLDLNLYMNIELKLPENHHPEDGHLLIQELVRILDNNWPSDRALPLVSSFHWELLYLLRDTHRNLWRDAGHSSKFGTVSESVQQILASVPEISTGVPQISASVPEIPVGFLTESCTADMIETIASVPNAALHCHYSGLTPELMLKANDFSLPVLIYTVNDAKLADQLLKAGAFGIFSDNGGLDHSMLR